ncbi:MAG TPA: VOC family protein [Candidatus Udaeobacter sp.]|jgi:predicted enzyme related to lactoylglutathione lyase|nr:VOC family protein [Candidatus Udaeobacter sp.]
MAARKSKRSRVKPGSGSKKRAAGARSKRARAPRASSRRAASRPRKGPASGRKASRAKRAGKPAASRAPRAGTAPATPSAIGFVSQHMDYTTHNYDGVRRFYTELLGFSSFRDMSEGPYLAVQTGPSSSLGFMPPRPGPPEQWQPPREPTLYLIVESVDRAHRELSARGVVFEQEPADMPWGHRVATLRDPEGRSVSLAEVRNRPGPQGE